MTGKIFKSIFLSAMAIMLTTLVVVFFVYYHYYDQQARNELKSEAEYIKAGVELLGEEYLENTADGSLRISWIAADGSVLYDTEASPDGVGDMDNHSEREEIKAALADGEGYSVRYSDTMAKRTLYYATVLSNGTVIRVCSAYGTVLSMMIDILSPALILFILVSLLALLVAKSLAASVVRPINEIDPEHPDEAKVYEELKPVMSKLSSQAYKITRQMAELKMKENEFNSITSNISAGMIVVNSKTVILSCNNSAKEILGLKNEVPRGILSINNSPSFREAIIAALSGKNGYDTLTKGDRHYSILVTPIFDGGSVEGAVVALLDDTEKEQRDALRREFTSNVSHELKTPLTSISGFAELISCGMADIDESRHFAGNIKKEANRLITLVGDIIRLTQLDGGEIPYDGEIDLYEVADGVVERLEPIATKNGISLSLEGERVRVMGTYQILEEVVYNLCDNAIKYNFENGYVKITVGTEDGAPFIRVKDGGMGIPRDKQDRVFERFYRVDKSHSKEIGGTGLGLSIVKHAVAYHRASISLVSDEGKGTEMTVSFPSL